VDRNLNKPQSALKKTLLFPILVSLLSVVSMPLFAGSGLPSSGPGISPTPFSNRAEIYQEITRVKLRGAHDPASSSRTCARLARLYLQAREPKKAISLLRYGLIIDSSRASSFHRKIGDIYQEMGEDKTAAEEYELADRSRPPSARIRARRQLEAWKEERREDLILQQYLFFFWTGPRLRHLYLGKIARLLMRQGKEEEARHYFYRLIEYYRDRIKEKPERALDYYLRLAGIYEEMREIEAAEREYDRAVEIEGEEGWHALLKEADFYRSRDKWEKAVTLYQEAETRKGVDLISLRLKIAGLLKEQGKTGAALDWMEKAAAAAGEEGAGVRLKIARYLAREERLEEALDAYREVFPLLDLPSRAGIMERIGKILSDLGREEEAAEAYLKAIDLWRENLGAQSPGSALLERLADLAGKAGQTEMVTGYYEELIEVYRNEMLKNPGKAAYYHRKLGRLCRDLERYAEAAAHYRSWSLIKPEDPDPNFRLYRLYRNQLDNKEIADYYYARYRKLRDKEKRLRRND